MKIVDPKTGRAIFQKRRRRHDQLGHARELTFSCYRHYRLLESDRVHSWFLDALADAREKWRFDLCGPMCSCRSTCIY